ncbi:Fc.00g008450.m01.CDS01 [Cosmosporella sp. VM-42]
MAPETVQPDQWVALRLPNETMRVLQVVPNTTISLGKYGAFPTNLILERPFHLTYEVQDKLEGESFSRLRVVPAKEVNADALADTSAEPTEGDDVVAAAEGEEMTLVDESGKVVIRSNREIIDEPARQTLTAEEIEELKRKGASAGKELIAKLLLSHTAIDQKTAYSLAKYKLLKTKKYIRRFTILPLDATQLGQWLLEERDSSKILDIRQELMALVGCWSDVHFGGVPCEETTGPQGGRWLTVDDTGGLLVAAMAERMGILYRKDEEEDEDEVPQGVGASSSAQPNAHATEETQRDQADETTEQPTSQSPIALRQQKKRPPRRSDFDVPYMPTNTITLIHGNTQANLALLRYFNYDATNPNPSYPYHPLTTNLMSISWLQLLAPDEDDSYTSKPPDATPEEIASWKTNRRGNYHRKRRRWARIRHIVDTARAGGFSGLAVASTMDPISIVKHTLPLLAGGAPVAIYSPAVEPLTMLADCFSVARRAAWVTKAPPEIEGKTLEELERWEGTPEFPLNPTLLLGVTIQTSRAKRWQVLPGRTHPIMMGRGGADGFVFTAWRAIPVEGKIEARGKFKRRKTEAP